jgi:endonuclease/exonuclease/phosphatase family metal-dependent hydrolase
MTAVFGGNIKLQGGEYGNAVLTRLSETGRRNVALPSPRGGEQRGALVVDLTAADAGKTPVRFIATHLDHRPDDVERLESVKRIEEVAREKPDLPTILVGDHNSRPESPVMAAFGANWTRADSSPAPSFPALKPKHQIDFVLVRPASRWKVVETRVLDEPLASDHRPVLAVLELVD